MKNAILVVALLSLVACGGGSPTTPSYVASPIFGGSSSAGNTSAELVDVIVEMWDHTFDNIRCDAITMFLDGRNVGVLRHPYSKKIASKVIGKYPEGVHTFRAINCRDAVWQETFTLRFPGTVIFPYTNTN